MRDLRHGETSDVAHDAQYVFVHGIDVIEVVLHLADDAPEGRDIAPQSSVLVGEPQRAGHPRGAAQQLQELLPVARVLAKSGIDQPARPPEIAQRGGVHALQLGMLLQQQKALEYRRRLSLEHPFIAGRQHLVPYAKAFVDRVILLVHRWRDAGIEVLHDDGGGLRNGLGRAVVALHQLLACESMRPLMQTELAGKRGLEIEQHAVFAPAGEMMQAYAQRLKELLILVNFARFGVRDHSTVRQFAPAFADARCARNPERGLEITQSASTFLDVGLEVGLGVTHVALLLLQQLCLEKLGGIERITHALDEPCEQFTLAGKQARFQQGGLNRDVLCRQRFAFIQRAHAVADFNPDIPQRADQVLNFARKGSIRRGRQQDQEVDVGAGEELPAAVAAHGGERHFARHCVARPEILEQAVDHRRLATQLLPGRRAD